MPAAFKWTKEQIQDMLTSYEQGESLRKIAQRYETSWQVLSVLLKKHGLVLRSQREAVRRHTCNYAYFHDIDSEEKAYWLGFLTADGCITKGDRVTVHLASVDCEHLYKLKKALDATQVISEGKRSCSLVICSPEMAADLTRHGILPNKTFSTKPAQIAPEMARHYWRGVFDGDGCIFRNGKLLVLVGDYDIILGFQAFVFAHCPKIRASITRKETIYQFKLQGDGKKRMLEVLYGDVTVYLDRKYKLAK
jgi:hypothetical protein